MNPPHRIHATEDLNARLQAITRRARVDMRYLHDDRSREHVVAATQSMQMILDVGGGMRGHGQALTAQVETLDLNDIEERPRPT